MKNTSWSAVADWYGEYLEGKGREDTYQKKVILPNLLRLMQIKKGEKVLDIACGQGFFSREMARAGAEVVGVDVSRELIKSAERLNSKSDEGRTLTNPSYQIGFAHELSFLESGTIDKAIAVLALQNIENYQDVLAEAARVLKPRGILYTVLNHPAFRVPKGSEWGWDPEKQIQYRRVDRYLSELKVAISMHPGLSSDIQTVSFHRSLQLYFKAFNKTGFVVSRLEEWISHKKSGPGPRAKAEDWARKEFPLFLALEAVKSA